MISTIGFQRGSEVAFRNVLCVVCVCVCGVVVRYFGWRMERHENIWRDARACILAMFDLNSLISTQHHLSSVQTLSES
jgi:hypothetical protein